MLESVQRTRDVNKRTREKLGDGKFNTSFEMIENLEEKFYGKLSSAALKSWVHWAILSDRDDIEIQCRCPESDSRGKFGRVLGELWINCTEDGHEFGGWTNINKWMCENGYAVGYRGQNKDDVKDQHWQNRLLLEEHGVHELLQWDEN